MEIETRETVKAFAERVGVTMPVAFTAASNPNIDDMPEGSTHWRVILAIGGRTLETPWSMGPALKDGPELISVLGALISDAAGYENARSFEEWCGDYGYDTDSRRAERTYNATAESAKALRRFLADEYEHAIWETED